MRRQPLEEGLTNMWTVKLYPIWCAMLEIDRPNHFRGVGVFPSLIYPIIGQN